MCLLDGVRGAIEFPRAVPAKLECGLAQRLRRDRAEIDAAAAEHGPAFDDRDLLVELGTLDRRALAGCLGSDRQQIVVERVPRHPLASCPPRPIDNAISL